jgi:peptidoglycan/xylan/chitin deacetylase (PgdA/CDA1 family)
VAEPPKAQPGIHWSEAQLQKVAGTARVGKRLLPKRWPGGARMAVCLSFDVDNEAPVLARGETSPNVLSNTEYGAEAGLPRILALLDRHQVPATFFIPAVSALLHPTMIPEIVKRGRHEIGVHGYIHESLPDLPPGEEARLLRQAIESLTQAMGKRPVGYRAPSGSFSGQTIELLRQHHFLYDSSLMALDDPYELFSNGATTGLVELPIEWTLVDSQFIGRLGGMPSPSLVFQVFQEEFDAAYELRGLFLLLLHPQLSGHRAPLAQLERLVAHMKSRPGVWFATGEQIARFVSGTDAEKAGP